MKFLFVRGFGFDYYLVFQNNWLRLSTFKAILPIISCCLVRNSNFFEVMPKDNVEVVPTSLSADECKGSSMV